MNTKNKILIGIIISCLGLLFFSTLANFFQWGINKEANKSIGQISQEWLELTETKQNCLDNLPFLETIEAAKGKSEVCSEWNEKIESLRFQHQQLLNKPYKQGLGLLSSR